MGINHQIAKLVAEDAARAQKKISKELEDVKLRLDALLEVPPVTGKPLLGEDNEVFRWIGESINGNGYNDVQVRLIWALGEAALRTIGRHATISVEVDNV